VIVLKTGKIDPPESTAYNMVMTERGIDLTGIWQGLYSYPSYLEPVFFVATIIGHGTSFSGTTHEAQSGRSGAPLTVFASLSGSRDGSSITFTKSYDGTGGWEHAIAYAGTLSADSTEIEGEWTYPGSWSGQFLMMRGIGTSETIARRTYRARERRKNIVLVK
jgi:hypothetical protein